MSWRDLIWSFGWRTGTSPVIPFDHLFGSYRDDAPKFADVNGDTTKGAIFE